MYPKHLATLCLSASLSLSLCVHIYVYLIHLVHLVHLTPGPHPYLPLPLSTPTLVRAASAGDANVSARMNAAKLASVQ